MRTTTYNSGLAMGSELSNHHHEVRNHRIEKKSCRRQTIACVPWVNVRFCKPFESLNTSVRMLFLIPEQDFKEPEDILQGTFI
jgi:hypothetical protein